MVAAGLRDEVRSLLAQGYGHCRAMKSVGYRQAHDAVLAGSDDDEALATEIIRVTRIFARRQRTWLRDQPIRWISPWALTADFDALQQQLRREL